MTHPTHWRGYMKKLTPNNDCLLPGGDPAGRLFRLGGCLMRGVRAGQQDFYRQLLTGGTAASLLRAGLIPTEITDYFTDEYPLVVRHEEVWPVTYPFEWPGAVLLEAATFFCKFARTAADLGIHLKDAHGYNVIFDRHGRPHYIDLCSLVPGDAPGGLLPNEFNRYFLNPLYLMSLGMCETARELIHLGGYETGLCLGGVDDEEVLERAHGLLRNRYIRFREQESRLRQADAQHELLDFYLDELKGMDLRAGDSCWSTYYCVSEQYPSNTRFSRFTPGANWEPKQRFLYELFRKSEYKTVLDIGCSAGWFSRLAAISGKDVIAMDRDEPALQRLYWDAREQGLPVSPVYCDFSRISELYPATGLQGRRRFRCDIVLALALLHHLVFKARMTIEAIVEILYELTDKVLVIEYLDEDDGSVQTFRAEGDAPWYCASGLERVLRHYFRDLEIIDSTGNMKRTLYVCRGPIPGAVSLETERTDRMAAKSC